MQQKGYMMDSPHHLIEAIKNEKRASNKPNHYSTVDREGLPEPGLGGAAGKPSSCLSIMIINHDGNRVHPHGAS